MKNILLAIFALLFVNFLTAQKENNIWYFGNKAGLDFNSGSPEPLSDGQIATLEGCASISNSMGEILFYTSGSSVWNKEHNIMPNGDSLQGNYSSSQSALIVPFPGDALKYYIFTTGAFNENNFYYSIVDMSLNNGLGDIILKNQLLLTNVDEKLSATTHSNNADYWVMVTQGKNNNKFYAYQISSSGINLTPVISTFNFGFSSDNKIGCLKFSVSGNKIARASSEYGFIDLYDFNKATGIVSNERHLPCEASDETGYGVEFSYSGKYLYATTFTNDKKKLVQWDISSGTTTQINSTFKLIADLNGEIGSLQLGPDKKIYVGRYYKPGVINNPELSGWDCNFIDTAIPVGDGQCLLGLPNMIASNYKLTSTSENKTQLRFTVFPNPFFNNISFEIQKARVKNVSYTITNVLGQIVESDEENSPGSIYTKDLDLSSLTNGVYFLSVKADDEIGVKVIIKQ